jgi:hypothetical protein
MRIEAGLPTPAISTCCPTYLEEDLVVGVCDQAETEELRCERFLARLKSNLGMKSRLNSGGQSCNARERELHCCL